MYKAGTKVIITCAMPEALVKFGEIYTATGHFSPKGTMHFRHSLGCRHISKHDCQGLAEVAQMRTKHYVHPIDWMKPFEDPDTIEDESIMDIVEDIKRLAEEI